MAYHILIRGSWRKVRSAPTERADRKLPHVWGRLRTLFIATEYVVGLFRITDKLISAAG